MKKIISIVVVLAAFVAMIIPSSCSLGPDTLKNGVIIDSMSKQQVDSFIEVCVENLDLAAAAVAKSLKDENVKARDEYKGEDLTYLTGRLGYIYRAKKLNGKQYAVLPALRLMTEWLKPGDKMDQVYFNILKSEHQDGLRDFGDEYKEGLKILKETFGMDIESVVNQ